MCPGLPFRRAVKRHVVAPVPRDAGSVTGPAHAIIVDGVAWPVFHRTGTETIYSRESKKATPKPHLRWLSQNPKVVRGFDDAQLQQMYGALIRFIEAGIGITNGRLAQREYLVRTAEVVGFRLPNSCLTTFPTIFAGYLAGHSLGGASSGRRVR